VVTQFRERYLEGVRVEQRILEDSRGAGAAGKRLESSVPKQTPLGEAA
jgi:hypothetical protein